MNKDPIVHSSNRHIPKNVVCTVLSATKEDGVSPLDAEDDSILRSMLETECFYSNLFVGYDVGYDENNNKHWLIPAQTHRLPSMFFRERKDAAYMHFLSSWIQQGWKIDLLFFEPTQDYDGVVFAWKFINCVPTSTGTYETVRDVRFERNEVTYNVDINHRGMVVQDEALVLAQNTVKQLNELKPMSSSS